MARTNIASGITVLVVLALLLLASIFFCVPLRASAAISISSSLGGGNALMRATLGQSQGVGHASTTSNLSAHLAFASLRGGSPEETPPANQNTNTGGGTSSDQSDGENGADGASAGGAGGTTAGNGGNGGDGGGAAPGGLIQAGGAVSNANAINAINTSIIRFTLR